MPFLPGRQDEGLASSHLSGILAVLSLVHLDSGDVSPLAPTHYCYLPLSLTYGPVPVRVHLLSHAQCLCGGNVHITGDHHQVDGLLFLNVLLDESLDL